MIKKIYKLWFITTIGCISIPTIVSCSKSPNLEDTNNVYNGFLEDKINITIDSAKQDFTLEDLKNFNFQFEIKKYQGNNELEKDYYDQLNKSLSKSSIKFLDFYIPKLNDDNNTYALFKINDNSEKIIEFPINKFLFKNNNQQLKKLSASNINSLIKNKIYSNYSFISDLIVELEEKIIRNYKEELKLNNNLTFDTYWKNNNLNLETQKTIENNILQKYPLSFSNDIYPNLFISIINVVQQNNKIELSFKISTSNFDSNNEIFFQIENLVLWI